MSDGTGRFRFSVRSLFILSGLISILLALSVYVNARFAHQRFIELPNTITVFRVEYPLGSHPYTVGAGNEYRLGSWITNTTPSSPRDDLESVLSAELKLHQQPDIRVDFQVETGAASPEKIYFQWENKLRVGSFASLRSIIVPRPEVLNSTYYWDENNDGVVDAMYQMDSTNSHAIVWKDTDADRVFDREHFENHGERIGTPSVISVPIPPNATAN